MMIEFYREMKINRRIGKAEALRKTQLLLLQGEYKAGEIPMWRRGLRISKVEGNQAPSFERDNKARYAHPYFWSPFVLMGNWR
jgi:CHAT domain-containing protein